MSTSVLTQPARSNNYTDVRRHLNIPLAHAQIAIGSGNHNVVSGPISTPTLRRTRPECTKLQLYDRYSQQMLVLACMFVGCVLVCKNDQNSPVRLSSVGTSALAINGFNDQPVMRIPLMVATITSWFTLAALFLSSMQVHSLDQLEWVRPLHFFIRRHLTVQLGTHETNPHVSCWILGPVWPRVYRRVSGIRLGRDGMRCRLPHGRGTRGTGPSRRRRRGRIGLDMLCATNSH